MGERYALIIGVNAYRDATIPPLRFAGNDAVAMRDFLIHPELGKFKKENVHLLLDSEATLGDLRSQFVYWLGTRVHDQDEVWIYFSGRGTTDRISASAIGQPFTNYLIVHDTLREDLPNSAISLKQLQEWLDLLGEARLTLLFDCGFSPVNLGRALASSKPPALDDFAFLSTLTHGKRRFLLVGTGPTEISLEDTDIELGLFSRILLQRLRTAALMQSATRISWNEFYQTVTAEVAWQAEKRGAMQNPLKFGTSASEPIFAFPSVLTPPPIPIPVREPRPEPEPVMEPAPEPEPVPEPESFFEPEPVAAAATNFEEEAAATEQSDEVFQAGFHAAPAEPPEPVPPAAFTETEVVSEAREQVQELLYQAQEEARTDNLYRAQNILEKAVALDPKDRRAANGLRKIEEAIRHADRKVLVKAAYSAALRYTDEKNYSEALHYYAKVLEMDPNSESARLGIESCRALLERQSQVRASNGRFAVPKAIHEKAAHTRRLKSYNETIWPFIGWVALLGCVWELFSTQAEGDSTAWVFWRTVASGMLGAMVGWLVGSGVFWAKHLLLRLEARQAEQELMKG